MSVSGITETALYLTFILEDETFAIDVSQVREVLDMSRITKVPRTPDFLKGVINVRGTVVPVVDFRLKFGMPGADTTVHTRIMILEIPLDNKTVVVGAIADSVNDVIEFEPDRIEPPPEIGSRWRSDFIKGIGKRDDKFIMIIDVSMVFSTEEIALVGATGQEGNPENQETG
ncbi:MAG: chemotaxis protein CheW [Thermodesulfobacteriota bacterium]|nr:chemotaxis protein CheW [Thermodesulfobacteriota bacterium]